MALKFQYNKTALQNLRRQLSIREKALPTLKSKEAALRLEVRKITAEIELLKEEYQALVKQNQNYNGFWTEFPEIVKIRNVNSEQKNIAGVKVSILTGIDFDIENAKTVITEEKEEYEIKAGDFFVIYPKVIHSFDYTDATTLISLYDKGVELSDGTKDILR